MEPRNETMKKQTEVETVRPWNKTPVKRLGEISRELRTKSGMIEERRLAARRSGEEAFKIAIESGRLLLEAKNMLPHGEWLPWLGEHAADISEDTARNYMSLANPEVVRDLNDAKTLKDAYEILGLMPKRKALPPHPQPAAAIERQPIPIGQKQGTEAIEALNEAVAASKIVAATSLGDLAALVNAPAPKEAGTFVVGVETVSNAAKFIVDKLPPPPKLSTSDQEIQGMANAENRDESNRKNDGLNPPPLWQLQPSAAVTVAPIDFHALLYGASKTPEGQQWLEAHDASVKKHVLRNFTASEANEWIATTVTGSEWCIQHDAEIVNDSKASPTPASVTAWVLTPKGQSWLKDFQKQHSSASLKPDKNEKDIVAGRSVRIPTGPPMTLAHLSGAMETLTALVPSDADHAKFGDLLSTFAAKQLVLAKKITAYSPYTSK